ncbi:HXXEE domain-containing protein [Candidatus Margulisiibacteriota bacterium]
MMDYLYKNWPKIGIVSAVFILVMLIFYPGTKIGSLQWLFWLLVPVYMIHQFEEYVFPGGFKNELNQEVMKSSNSESPLNDKTAFWINVPIVWVIFPISAIIGLNFVLIPAVCMLFAAANGILHLAFSIRKMKYGPGFLASLFLNIPLAVYTVGNLIAKDMINTQGLVIATVIALFLHSLIPIYLIKQGKASAG